MFVCVSVCPCGEKSKDFPFFFCFPMACQYSFLMHDEVELDWAMYRRARFLHLRSSWAATNRSMIQREIFQSDPQFFWNGKAVRTVPEFQDHFNDHWIPYARGVMDEIWTLGIFAVRYVYHPEEDLVVPVLIVGGEERDYTITVRRNQRTDSIQFTFYRFISRSTGKKLLGPIVDPNVRVFSGFGYDPSIDGKLQSMVSTLLEKEIFLRHMSEFTLRAEYNLSNPMLVTETTPTSAGAVDLGKNKFDYYWDNDAIKENVEDRFERNKAEIELMLEQQAKFFQSAMTTHDEIFTKQVKGNIYPLPVDHHLVQQQLPVRRGDWNELSQHYENVVSAAYGVARANIIADQGTRNEAGAGLVQRSFFTTISEWKRVLGRVLTLTYRAIYNDADVKYTMNFHRGRNLVLSGHDPGAGGSSTEGKGEKEKAKKKKNEKKKDIQPGGATMPWHKSGVHPRVCIKFIVVPNETQENAMVKYALGIIDWCMFRQVSLNIAGYPTEDTDGMQDDCDDPWDQTFKLSMARTLGAAALHKLGQAGDVVFSESPQRVKERSSGGATSLKKKEDIPPSTSGGEGTDAEKKKKKKRKLSAPETDVLQEDKKKKKKKKS